MDLFIWHQIGEQEYHLTTKEVLKAAQTKLSDPEDIMVLYKFKEDNLKLAKKIIRELNRANEEVKRMPGNDNNKLAS